MEEVSNVANEAGEIVVEQGEVVTPGTGTGGNEKRKRSKKQVKYLANRGRRRAFDKTKLESLAIMLDEWFTRTKLPVVAIALETNLKGESGVRFIGKEIFAEFVRDEGVRKKFVNVAIDGLSKLNDTAGVETQKEECDPTTVDILLTADIMRLSVKDKRSLLAELVSQSGSKGTGGVWVPEKKPVWWDEEHWRFESPNNGTPRMSVDALDAVLLDCRTFYHMKRHDVHEKGEMSMNEMEGEEGREIARVEEGEGDVNINEMEGEEGREIARVEEGEGDVNMNEMEGEEGREIARVEEGEGDVNMNEMEKEEGRMNVRRNMELKERGSSRSKKTQEGVSNEGEKQEAEAVEFDGMVGERKVEMNEKKIGKVCKRKRRQVKSQKQKMALKKYLEKAKNGESGEVSSRGERDASEKDLDAENFEFACEHLSWTPESCEDLMSRVKIESWNTAMRFAMLLPERSLDDEQKPSLSSFNYNDIDLWVRHLIPEEDRLQDLEPLKVRRENDDIYRCLSKMLYKVEFFWPVLKLMTIKYAIINEKEVVGKLQKQRNVLQLFSNLLSNEEVAANLSVLYRSELLSSFEANRKCSPVHLMLASEALSISIRISSSEYFFENGDLTLKFLLTPTKLGAVTRHVVPLVKDEAFSQHQYETRSKSMAPCAAGEDCSLTVGVSPSVTTLQCRHCLRFFHTTCSSTEKAESLWYCGCAYEADDLKNLQKFSSVREMKKLLATYKDEIQTYLIAIKDGEIYCKRMILFTNRSYNSLQKESSQMWLLNSDTMELILQHCAKIAMDIFYDVQERNLVRLRMDVMLPESCHQGAKNTLPESARKSSKTSFHEADPIPTLKQLFSIFQRYKSCLCRIRQKKGNWEKQLKTLSLLIHLEEGIPIIAARRISGFRPAQTTINNATPKKRRRQQDISV